MKHSTIYILISNLWLIGTWFVEGTFAKLIFLIMGMLWLLGYVFSIFAETKLMDLDYRLNRLKRHNEELKHEHIIRLLETIAGKKKARKK